MKKSFYILMALLPFSLFGQDGSSQKTGISVLISSVADDPRFRSFEVSEDMFKAFCELEYADSSTTALFKRIKSVKMLEYQYTDSELKKMEKKSDDERTVDPWFYDYITGDLDVSGYTLLLKSRSKSSIALLLKKENGPADSEFLLVTDKMVIDIRGDIMVKTIYQMEEMMSYVQQILPN